VIGARRLAPIVGAAVLCEKISRARTRKQNDVGRRREKTTIVGLRRMPAM
jgi:hypothetical protein